MSADLLLALTPAFLARVAGAAVTALLLYVLLSEPGDKPAATLFRRVLFALMAAAVVWLATAPDRGTTKASAKPVGDPARSFEAYGQAYYMARTAFSNLTQADPKKRSATPYDPKMLDQSVKEYRKAIRYRPDSPRFRRELALILALQGNETEAREHAREALSLAEGRRAPNLPAQRRFWDAAVGEKAPRGTALAQLPSDARAADLGWMEPLGRYIVFQRAEQPDQAQAAYREVQRVSRGYLFRVIAFVVVALVVGVLGAIFAVLGIGLAAAGILKRIPAEHHRVTVPLLETFILYLFVTLALSPLLSLLLGSGIAQLRASRGGIITIILLSDLLTLGPLAYLALRLRGRGLKLAEIGLHGRQWWQHILYGFAGYAVLLPVMFIVSIATNFISERFFPNVTPPYHPINEMLLGSREAWLRFGLFVIVAVGAPLFEEIFFRGVLYGALRRRWGVAAGVLASSAIFAILHPQLPLGFIPIFVLAVGFALMYEWRQSLVPSMVMHALQNSLVFVASSVFLPPSG